MAKSMKSADFSLPEPNPRNNPAAKRMKAKIENKSTPRPQPKAKTAFENATDFLTSLFTKSKASAPAKSGSLSSASQNYKRSQAETAAVRREMADEASRGGRGKRYDKLSAQLDRAKAQEQQALSVLQGAEARQRNITIGTAGATATALVGGLAVGARMAKKADARFVASTQNNRGEITKLAKRAGVLMDKLENGTGNSKIIKAELKAISKEGRKFTQRGPLSLGKISGLVAATYLTRKLASEQSDPIAKGALNVVATGETAIAIGLAGQTYLNRNNSIAKVAIADVAKIKAAGEAGRMKDAAPVKKKAPKAKGAPAPKVKARTLSSRVSNLERAVSLSKIAGRTVAKALPLAMPVGIGLSLGTGLTEARAATRRGDSAGAAKAGVRTIRDISNQVTFGAHGLIESHLRRTAGAVTKIADRIANERQLKPISNDQAQVASDLFARQVVLAHARKQRAQARTAATSTRGRLTPLQTINATDGFTDAHTRRVNGRTVRVSRFRTPGK